MIFFFYGLSYTVLDPLVPIISESLKSGFGKIGFALFVGSLFSLVTPLLSGRFSDKFDVRFVILLGLFLLFLGFFSFGIYSYFWSFILFIIFNRVGYGIIDPSILNHASRLFDKDYGKIFLKLDLFWHFGAIASPLLVSLVLLLNIDIKYIFISLSFSFGVLLSIFYYSFPRTQKNSRSELYQNFSNHDLVKLNWLSAIRNPIVLVTSIATFFHVGSIFGLSTWLTTYFTAFNVKVSYGSAILSLYWVFSTIGIFLTIRVLKKTNEITLLLLGTLLSIISIGILGLTNSISVKIFVLMIQAISVSGFFSLTKSIVVHENPNSAGTLIGFNMTAGLFGGMLFQPALGYIAEEIGKNFTVYLLLLGWMLSFVFLSITYVLLNRKYKTRVKISK